MISCKLKRHHKKSYFPVVSIYGQPPPSVKFPLRFHTCKHSKQIPVNEKKVWKLLGNLTGGFHEFPHLGTVYLRIPPRFPALETLGKPHRWFPRVSTPEIVNPRTLYWTL